SSRSTPKAVRSSPQTLRSRYGQRMARAPAPPSPRRRAGYPGRAGDESLQSSTHGGSARAWPGLPREELIAIAVESMEVPRESRACRFSPARVRWTNVSTGGAVAMPADGLSEGFGGTAVVAQLDDEFTLHPADSLSQRQPSAL